MRGGGWRDGRWGRCEATAEPAARLVDGAPVPWDSWSTWVGGDCRYCRFDRPAALRCLSDKRLLIVGDSVRPLSRRLIDAPLFQV